MIHTETDENGSVTREELGVRRILDAMLLEEIIQYSEGGNYDRLVAAQLAIAQAMKMDPIIGKVSDKKDGRYESLGRRKEKSRLFSEGRSLFYNKKSKLFV